MCDLYFYFWRMTDMICATFPLLSYSWIPDCTNVKNYITTCGAMQNVRFRANNMPKLQKRYLRHMGFDNISHTVMGKFQQPFVLDSWKSSSCLLEWSGVFSVVALWVTFSDKINVAEAILPRAIKKILVITQRINDNGNLFFCPLQNC